MREECKIFAGAPYFYVGTYPALALRPPKLQKFCATSLFLPAFLLSSLKDNLRENGWF